MKDAMKVELINTTPNSLELLILTKSGRLKTGTTFEEIMSWPMEQKLEHLGYMMDTIKTSFEFVDYVFRITNVSRAFTHQLVRTRTASYQQEAMRVVDARDAGYLVTLDDPIYAEAAEHAFQSYGKLVDKGYPVQDCRGILPTAVFTNIYMKANLRTLADMSELRLCKRAEGEYQKVFKLMVAEVLKVTPWAEPLLTVHCVRYGVCAFPRYTKCPVQQHCFDPRSIRGQIYEVWSNSQHVANPVASKDGRTM